MDHSEKVHREQNPKEKANILSLLTFVYTRKILSKGFKKELEDDDLYEVTRKCQSEKCANKMEKAYVNESKASESGNVSLVKILWNLYGMRFLVLGLIHMTGRLLNSTLEPEALSNLIAYFKPNQTAISLNDAMFYAGIMIGLKILHTMYLQNYMVFVNELAIQIRTSFCSFIYRKTLKLSPKALEDTNLGNIVTVITKDVSQFDVALRVFNDVWISVIQTIVTCYLIYVRIGATSLAGVLMIICLIPIQAYMSTVIRGFRLKMAKRTDERLQRTQEALSTIKTIKMYTWEKVFADKIGEARYKELRTLLKSAFSKTSLSQCTSLASRFSLYAVLMLYIHIYKDMAAEDIFYVTRQFGTLRHSVSFSFSLGFARIGELTASLKRVNHILQLEELPEHVDKHDDDPQICLKNASVRLQGKDILKNINLKLKKGLNIITGQLGSGKSSLIKVMLRDFPVEEGGEVTSRGKKSYASQDPWLFPSSIRQNILFGDTYDSERYQKVIAACALEYDFGILEKGDETIVADRGMNLSKGQQARINLARAIYKNNEIYLIDDALTALDSNVQEHIFTQCIQGLLKDKCVVLVTHNAKHIQAADTLVILENGALKYAGKQQNISREQLAAYENLVPEVAEDTNEESYPKSDEKTKLLEKSKPQIRRKQVYHENKKAGSVDFKLYIDYVKMGGGYFVIAVMMFFYLSTTFAESTAQKQLTVWINYKTAISSIKEKHFHNTTIDLEDYDITNATTIFLNNTFNVSSDIFNKINILETQATKTLHLYTLLLVSATILELFKNYIILRVGFKAAMQLHAKMMNKIVNATMAFFDSFFVGNILNRFAQDLSVIDEHLALTLSRFVEDFFELGGVIGLIASVRWSFMIPALIMALFSISARFIYIRTARSLKRLEAATRSPIVGHLNSTMEGLTTVRAYKAQEILKTEFDRHQDLFTSACYTSIYCRGAFGFYTGFASTFVLCTVITRFLFFDTGIFTGDVGLTLNQSGHLSMVIHGILATWSELEYTMTSTERAMEYTTIETENTSGSELTDWPTKGEITYEKVSLTYTNSQERVLKDVSFVVKPRTRIGIVGRTGAGKSSIISTLYRLYNYQGNIFIDGVDLKTLSLKFLRQHISIIPQDPIMFSGTVRSNVDPLNKFTDEEVWKTLHKVHLDTGIPNLQAQVGDVNFSTGERQLICLARAILNRNKILVLDEATANMDPETELLAQRIVEENFSSCTLLVVAHRLDAILQCNKVMVLNRGEVVEFDEPSVLLKDPSSFFSELMRNAAGNDHVEKKTL